MSLTHGLRWSGAGFGSYPCVLPRTLCQGSFNEHWCRWNGMKICASDAGMQRKPRPALFQQPPAGCVYINLWRRSHHLVAPCGGIILPFLSRCTYNMLDGAIWYGSQYLIQFWFALSHIMNRWFWFALVLGQWKALWKSPTHWILP